MPGIAEKIGGFFSGQLSDVLTAGADIVDRFVQTKEEKQEANIELLKVNNDLSLKSQQFAFMVDQEFNQRIKDLEGTAADLKQFGLVGRTIIFLRGAQRPIWGYGVMVFDYMVFSKTWDLSTNPQLESTFWVINLLVLGFLFGERAVKNVTPMVKDLMQAKTK